MNTNLKKRAELLLPIDEIFTTGFSNLIAMSKIVQSKILIFLSYFISDIAKHENMEEKFKEILEYIISSLSESGETASLAFLAH